MTDQKDDAAAQETVEKSAKVIEDERAVTPQVAHEQARAQELKRHIYTYFQHPDTGEFLALCACREEPFPGETVGDHIEGLADKAGREARERVIDAAVAAHKAEAGET